MIVARHRVKKKRVINILLSASQNEAPLRSEAVRWLVKIRGLEVGLKFSGNASGLSVAYLKKPGHCK